ncbi:hypothetical protein FQA39_LY12275 [Lamprigera yunnana]|nr:hypothetical protein FQA39_LY12275 [Lamprigera yunnana]
MILLQNHRFNICRRCSDLISYKSPLCTKIVTCFRCYVCRSIIASNPVATLEQLRDTLPGFNDNSRFCERYLCIKCVALLANLYYVYKYIEKREYDSLKYIENYTTAVTHVYQPVNLPLTIVRPREMKYTIHDYVRNILNYSDYYMRRSSVDKKSRQIIVTHRKLIKLEEELQRQQIIFQTLAEITRYVKISFDLPKPFGGTKRVYEETHEKTEIAIPTETSGGYRALDENTYIPANETVPINWDLIDLTHEEEEEDKDKVMPVKCFKFKGKSKKAGKGKEPMKYSELRKKDYYDDDQDKPSCSFEF